MLQWNNDIDRLLRAWAALYGVPEAPSDMSWNRTVLYYLDGIATAMGA